MKLLVGLVVGLAVLLSGCSGDSPTPKVDPTRSVASTPTQSPTQVESSDPPQALSPVQTVRAWFRAFSDSMISGDTSEVESLSSHGCASCKALIRSIAHIYDSGGHLETRGWSVDHIVEAPGATTAQPQFFVRTNESSRRLFDGDKEIDRTPATRLPMRLSLSKQGGSWVVAALDILG